MFLVKTYIIGHVAELVYAYVSEAYGAIHGSSSLPVPTKNDALKGLFLVGTSKPTAWLMREILKDGAMLS